MLLFCTSTINARKGSFEDEEALILGYPYPRIGASGGRAWVTLEAGSSVSKSTARHRGAGIFGTKKIGPRLLWASSDISTTVGVVNAAVTEVGDNGKR